MVACWESTGDCACCLVQLRQPRFFVTEPWCEVDRQHYFFLYTAVAVCLRGEQQQQQQQQLRVPTTAVFFSRRWTLESAQLARCV